MTRILIAPRGGDCEGLKKALEDDPAFIDHLVGGAAGGFVLATAGGKEWLKGMNPLTLDIRERQREELVALVSEEDVDFSPSICRIYSDPYSTRSLVEDERITDGFVVEAAGTFRIPEDTFVLHRAIKSGAKASRVFRRSGEESAAADSRILLARCGAYHPTVSEVLRVFNPDGPGRRLTVLPIALNSGRITLDNTFKPENVWMAEV